MQKIIGPVVLLAIFLILHTGCITTGATADSKGGFTQHQPDQPSPLRELVAGDTIGISVEVDGSMEVLSHRTQVNQQGMVTLPLVGDVKIGGYPLSRARDVIAKTYGAYYVNPPVIMLALLAGQEAGEWGSVTVMGSVGQPGRVPFPSQHGMNLTEAIQLAGGFAPSAKKSSIQVTRTDELGMKTRVSVDFNEIGQKGNADSDIKLIDGDIIYVSERIF